MQVVITALPSFQAPAPLLFPALHQSRGQNSFLSTRTIALLDIQAS